MLRRQEQAHPFNPSKAYYTRRVESVQQTNSLFFSTFFSFFLKERENKQCTIVLHVARRLQNTEPAVICVVVVGKSLHCWPESKETAFEQKVHTQLASSVGTEPAALAFPVLAGLVRLVVRQPHMANQTRLLSGFEMCFALGSQHLRVLGSKHVPNPACTERNPRPMACTHRFLRLLILEFVPQHCLSRP